ncbi:MAG: class I SAM-dependent methyltransferase [Pseudomonadales bacterium]|nr:class I SAM-dependent methyltransferase [Pseudomonadales bacterium]
MSDAPLLKDLFCLKEGLSTSSLLSQFVDVHSLPVEESLPHDVINPHTYYLKACQGEITLQPVDTRLGGALGVDFMSSQLSYRRQTSGIKQEVAKAVGCKADYRPRVLDVTAGLGGDAIVLACLGCDMTLVEKNPLVYLLLESGISQALHAVDSDVSTIVSDFMHLSGCQDSLLYMQGCDAGQFDVVYLDPMFPERKKSAKVKKAMQYFHDIVGLDEQQDVELLALALRVAQKRVVVKRPKLAPLLTDKKPSYQMKAKSIRYDVYLTLS